MTRIAYRRPEEMTEQALELTSARGNLNVYRALANAEKVFTGWMLAGQAALTSPVVPVRLRELVVLRTACRWTAPTNSASTGTSPGRLGSAPTRSRPSPPNPLGKKPISIPSNARCCA